MKLLALLILISTSAFAGFPIIDIQDLEGTYLDEKGAAHAQKAMYVLPKVEISHADIDVNFNKEEKKLRISDPNTSVVLDFDFSFLNIFKSFEFSGVEIKSTDKLFWLQSDQLNVFINRNEYQVEDLYVETDVRNIPAQDDEDISVVDGLILNAILRIQNLRFKTVEKAEFFDDLRQENPAKIAELNKIENNQNKGIPLIVRKLSYVVKEGKFTGKALLDSWINLWLRLNGEMSTNKENTQMVIHLKNAQLGVFSIKSTLLKRLRALNLDGVSVVKDKIYINLDTVILGGKV